MPHSDKNSVEEDAEEESNSEVTEELPIFIIKTKHGGALVPNHFCFNIDNM